MPLTATVSKVGVDFVIVTAFQALTKFVPQSDLSSLAAPLMAKKRRSALMNDKVSIDSITSMWMARVLMQVKITAHLLASA